MAQIFNPRTQETDAGGPPISGQPDYIARLYSFSLPKKKKKKSSLSYLIQQCLLIFQSILYLSINGLCFYFNLICDFLVYTSKYAFCQSTHSNMLAAISRKTIFRIFRAIKLHARFHFLKAHCMNLQRQTKAQRKGFHRMHSTTQILLTLTNFNLHDNDEFLIFQMRFCASSKWLKN